MEENTGAVELSHQCLQLQRSGLVIVGEPTFDEWVEAGRRLQTMETAVQFWIGDWLNYGERAYGDIKRLCEEAGIDYGYARNCKSVAEKFELSVRTDNLSFRHHEIAAPLPPDEAQDWLARSSDNGWSVARLRRELQHQRLLQDSNKGDGSAVVHTAGYADLLAQQTGQTVDLLLTDPPYLTEFEDVEGLANFVDDWLPAAFARLRPDGRAYVFIGAYPDELGTYLNVAEKYFLPLQQICIWTYQNTIGPSPKNAYKLNYQFILHFYGPEAKPLNCESLVEQFTVQQVSAPDGRHAGRLHEWQKPGELAERLIRHGSAVGDTVLDPFAGTGTFLSAAKALGRVGIGSEIDTDMLELCRARGIEVAP